MQQRDFNSEMVYKASRSSGSGGQHVNKVSSRVEVLFNIPGSVLLTDEEKELVIQKLRKKCNKEGVLRVVNQQTRSQFKNKESAASKMNQLINEALAVPKKRLKVKLSKAVKRKRFESKKVQSEKKQSRAANRIRINDFQ